ncbi:hypothetical protein A2U01_0107622, partial [Trifolium medium]|nr:hypothetical protein [Trifolium medium]
PEPQILGLVAERGMSSLSESVTTAHQCSPGTCNLSALSRWDSLVLAEREN